MCFHKLGFQHAGGGMEEAGEEKELGGGESKRPFVDPALPQYADLLSSDKRVDLRHELDG